MCNRRSRSNGSRPLRGRIGRLDHERRGINATRWSSADSRWAIRTTIRASRQSVPKPPPKRCEGRKGVVCVLPERCRNNRSAVSDQDRRRRQCERDKAIFLVCEERMARNDCQCGQGQERGTQATDQNQHAERNCRGRFEHSEVVKIGECTTASC